MNKSIVFKLVLAFFLVSIIGAALAAVFGAWTTTREFDRMVNNREQENFIAEVTQYYIDHGTWEGIQAHMDSVIQGPMPFGLATTDGFVLISAGQNPPGTRVDGQIINSGIDIIVNGEVVGVVIKPQQNQQPHPPYTTQEQNFLNQSQKVLLWGALAAAVIALLVGILLATQLTRPIRELTKAIHGIAGGQFGEQVHVRSKDEMGQLAIAFNKMSTDLAKATDMRRQLTADIAHDLRTPLTVLSGYMETMQDGSLEPTPERMAAMGKEVDHLLRLVEDLRTITLADTGELTLFREEMDPSELVTRVCSFFQANAERQGITLKCESASDLPVLLLDESRIVEVLHNLVSNALRHTPKGGQITVSADCAPGGVLLKVKDTGEGISQEDLPFIFDRFYRGDKSRRTSAGESGLGLAIARSLVVAHGGTINVESTLAVGSSFNIFLPL
ncbi:MAG TPA: ATP-binding protein [Longilinea sp.]|nr:ATP-binding protein [Longilinea sp.]